MCFCKELLIKSIVFPIFFVLILVSPTQAATRYVSPSGSNISPFTNLATAATTFQSAINICSAGDTVLVDRATYVIHSEISVPKTITLRSLFGAADTIIDATNGSRCVNITGTNVVFDGFTVQNGKLTSGGGAGLVTWAPCTIEYCIVKNNNSQPYGGGGIAMVLGGTLRNCLIVGNSGDGGGGAKCFTNTLVESCTIVSNSAGGNLGGGIYLNGGRVLNSIVYYNTGSGGYPNWAYFTTNAAYTNVCTTPAVTGTGNITDAPLFLYHSASIFELSPASPCVDHGANQAWMTSATDLAGNQRIFNSVVDMGAYEYYGTYSAATRYVSLSGHHVAPFDNWTDAATNIQAAIDVSYAGDTIFVSNGTYHINQMITISNTMSLRSINGPLYTLINGGKVCRCILITGTNVLVDGFTIQNGFTNAYGGGIFINAASTIKDCIIMDNIATAAFGNYYGGGVYVEYGKVANIQQCVFKNNFATWGGGIAIRSYGSTVRNCLIVSNSAGEGGGILADYGSTIQNCTIANNRGTMGGGIYGGVEIYNSIIYNNTSGNTYSNYYYSFDAKSENCCTAPISNYVGFIASNPLFLNPSIYDFRLATNSPCINAGVNESWMLSGYDLNQLPRIMQTNVDIGAYEYGDELRVLLSVIDDSQCVEFNTTNGYQYVIQDNPTLDGNNWSNKTGNIAGNGRINYEYFLSELDALNMYRVIKSQP